MSIDSLGIHLGPLYIHFYALILMTGMLAAAWLSARRAPQKGLDPNTVWDGLLWAIVPGLIGARIYHILTPTGTLTLQYYLQNPIKMLEIWNGGLGIYGAVIGGTLGVWYYCRRHNQPFAKWFDIVVPGLALGQAIARWGNFVNQELYGAPTNLPWAIYIPPDKRVRGFEQFERFHPLFLYESILNLAACLILLWLDRRYKDRLKPGDLFLVYLMMYPVIRFMLDFVRLESNTIGIITTAQLVSVVIFIIAAGLLYMRHRRPAETSVQGPGSTA